MKKWFWNNFSVGSCLFLSSFFVIIYIVANYHVPVIWLRYLMMLWFFACWVIDTFFDNHLLVNNQVHQRIRAAEQAFLTRVSDQDKKVLINWYAQWLAEFTRTPGRLLDLCAYQIAGTMIDLRQLIDEQQITWIDDQLPERLVDNWTLADEQVFKVYYGARIKLHAWRYLWKFRKERVLIKGLRLAYLDQLILKYGKTYCEYGIFLNQRLREGHAVRSLYEGLHTFDHQEKSLASHFEKQKMLLQGSLYSLKDLIKKSS